MAIHFILKNAMSGEDSELLLATSLLVLMVRGLFFKFNYLHWLHGDLYFDPLQVVISILDGLGPAYDLRPL